MRLCLFSDALCFYIIVEPVSIFAGSKVLSGVQKDRVQDTTTSMKADHERQERARTLARLRQQLKCDQETADRSHGVEAVEDVVEWADEAL